MALGLLVAFTGSLNGATDLRCVRLGPEPTLILPPNSEVWPPSVAVAVTGIAGPTGGTPEKPVGTVWIGWKRRGGYPLGQVFHFAGDREAVRRQTVAASLKGILELLG